MELENKDYESLLRGTAEYPSYGPGEKAVVTLRLVRGGAVRVRLRCEGASVPVAGVSAMVNMWPRGGGSRSGISAYGMQGKQDTFTKDGVPPGLRLITIEDEKGRFEPVPETEVEVLAGETAEVTLDLVRRAPVADVPPVEGIVRVVDDETGAPIAGAKVNQLVGLPGGGGWRVDPIPESAKPGEFRFRGPPGIVRIGAEAPGHVTMDDFEGLTMELCPGAPSVQEVRLPRAGELSVEFRGGGPSVAVEEVRVRWDLPLGARGWIARGFGVEGGRGRQDGLAPGTYTLEVKPGSGFERVPDRVVEIRAGEVTEVVVDLVALTPESESTSVRGTVTFHPAWGERDSVVRFRGADRTNADVDEEVTLTKVAPGRPASFAFGRLPRGRYRVEVKPQWATEVEVGEKGGTIDLSIPEPAEILVRVVAEETGERLGGARLSWHRPEEGLHSWTVESAVPDRRTGEIRLLVPPGPLDATAQAPGRVAVSLDGTGPDEEAVPQVFSPGEKAERTIRLPRAGMVGLTLRCGGALLDAKDETEPWILRGWKAGGRDGTTSWRMNGSGGAFTEDGLLPGKYTLQIRDPGGRFEPVPDREIQTLGGETTEVIVNLVRKR